MADLASKLEVAKLCRELDADEESLSFLTSYSAEDLRNLRAQISGATFARHEARFTRIAGLTKLLPTALTAKIAAAAIGPVLSAKIAGSLEPKDAIKLSQQLKPDFLTEVSMYLDPTKVQPIISGLPQELIIDVGRNLLAKDEHITLGRFVSVVSAEASLSVVDEATAHDILLVALYTEDVTALDVIVAELSDERLRDIIEAALAENQIEDALTIIGGLSVEGRARLITQAAKLGIAERGRMVAAVDHNGLWPDIVSVVEHLSDEAIEAMVNVDLTNDVEVLERIVDAVRSHEQSRAMARVYLALDDKHRKTLRSVPRLHEAAVQKWIIANAGDATDVAEAFINELKAAKVK